MTGGNQLISWTSSVRGRKLSRTCQKENSSAKLTKHLIKQNFKLELLLTCTPRLGVLTPLSRKGQTPSNVDYPELAKLDFTGSLLNRNRRSRKRAPPKLGAKHKKTNYMPLVGRETKRDKISST
ncbi:hypothetical protein J6590_101196 [Homalodisca vitripennis]|nr:hypothetical protein J6590_101196 [Homalodisca vitripennis]